MLPAPFDILCGGIHKEDQLCGGVGRQKKLKYVRGVREIFQSAPLRISNVIALTTYRFFYHFFIIIHPTLIGVTCLVDGQECITAGGFTIFAWIHLSTIQPGQSDCLIDASGYLTTKRGFALYYNGAIR